MHYVYPGTPLRVDYASSEERLLEIAKDAERTAFGSIHGLECVGAIFNALRKERDRRHANVITVTLSQSDLSNPHASPINPTSGLPDAYTGDAGDECDAKNAFSGEGSF